MSDMLAPEFEADHERVLSNDPVIVEPAGRSLDEPLANAFVEHCLAGRALYREDVATWVVHDDETGLWSPLPKQSVQVGQMFTEWRPNALARVVDKNGNAQITEIDGSLRLRRDVVELAKGHPLVRCRSDDFDSLDGCLPVANGVLDLRTRELTPIGPETRITRRADVAYDRDARAPKTWAFLVGAMSPKLSDGSRDRVAGERIARFWLRYLAMSLVPKWSEQSNHFVVAIGPGGGGKGTVALRIPQLIFSTRDARGRADDRRSLMVPLPSAIFLSRNAGGKHRGNLIESRAGAKLAVVDEGFSTGAGLDREYLLAWTGNTPIAAEGKGRDGYDVTPPKLTFLTNSEDLDFGGQSSGLRRRMLVVRFPWGHGAGQGEDMDEGLFARDIAPEASGILNLLLDAVADYAANGLDVPIEVAQASAETWASSSFVGSFSRYLRPVNEDDSDEVRDCPLTLNELYTAAVDLAACTTVDGARSAGITSEKALKNQLATTFVTASWPEGRGRVLGLRTKFTLVYGLTANEESGAYVAPVCGARPPRLVIPEVDAWRHSNSNRRVGQPESELRLSLSDGEIDDLDSAAEAYRTRGGEA